MNRRYLTLRAQTKRSCSAAASIALLGVLSACGAGTPTSDATSGDTSEAAVSGPSVSAAQLSNDANYSVTFAQAVAAGDIAAPDISASASPDLGAATPDSSVPTANSESSTLVNSTSSTDQNTENNSTTDSVAEPSEPEQAAAEESAPDPAPAEETASEEATVDALQQPEEETDNSAIQTPEEEPTPPEESGGSTNTTGSTTETQTNTTTEFFSATTPGFNGEVLDDSIRVTWPVDPDARGYNVYRQAQFVTSVFTEEYIDEDVFDRDYYYEIQAFDNDDTLYYVATGLTVKARTFGRIDPDAPVPRTDLLDNYELVFSEEFTGTELDPTKWNTSYLWGTDIIINSEEQFYVDTMNDPDFGYDPFSFDGEHLTINSIKTPDELLSKSLNQPYLSGVITSYDAFKFTYGYVETRAKVTFGRGYWPAFWLLNAYYVDDKPEIDIMEFIGHDQDVVYHTYHYFDSEGQLRSTSSQPTPGVDYTSDFHTYAVEWKPGTIIFYVNNVEVHRVTDPKVSQQEMYVIANTALGGWWAGSPDESTPFPGEYTIDYIRVYQSTEPYDDVLFSDGETQVPYSDGIFGNSSPSHRPSIEEWPEGYPDGL